MKRVTRNGLIAAAAASGALAAAMPAHADSAADGAAAGSPGLISGNTVQLPVHVPVNVCGNTLNVAGLLNPAAGNRCAHRSDGDGAARAGGGRHGGGVAHGGGTHRGGARNGGGAVAHGGGKDSPGVLSGNGLQLPVDLPVNVSGNSVTVVGLGNASAGNESATTSGGKPRQPHHPANPAPRPSTPPVAHPEPGVPERVLPQSGSMASLAHTGTDQTMPALAASAALLLGGAVLYRRFRPAAVR
ncbi:MULTISPECIES: chaplin [unclassified Streptomyces]|uniref:chaplin n=1 Tax=unclassified Streptomyces TaxID=2593676 RepID=UPI002B1E5D22|nr:MULTISPECIES: chaplin [unclassified Streptomyces]